MLIIFLIDGWDFDSQQIVRIALSAQALIRAYNWKYNTVQYSTIQDSTVQYSRVTGINLIFLPEPRPEAKPYKASCVSLWYMTSGRPDPLSPPRGGYRPTALSLNPAPPLHAAFQWRIATPANHTIHSFIRLTKGYKVGCFRLIWNLKMIVPTLWLQFHSDQKSNGDQKD